MIPSTLQVAALQYRAVPTDKAENIRSLARLATEAAVNGAKIIVLPEMCLTGLTIENSNDAGNLAEPIPGPATQVFSRIATRYKVYLILGLAEYDHTTSNFYNAQIIIGPTGQIVGKYRKINLYGPDYKWATPGDLGYQAVTVEPCIIGLGLCNDINFPEFTDYIAQAHVQLLAFSTNWVGNDVPFRYWSAIVAPGSYYFIAANNWGREGDIDFSGGSIILAPELSVLSQAVTAANTILYAGIEIHQG